MGVCMSCRLFRSSIHFFNWLAVSVGDKWAASPSVCDDHQRRSSDYDMANEDKRRRCGSAFWI